MYVRMAIGEAISEAQVKELESAMSGTLYNAALGKEIGMGDYRILREDGGNMVIVLTQFPTREECIRFHSSRGVRQMVQKTQHLLVGNYVVKLFQEALPL